MNTQNQIKRTLSQTANAEYVSRLLGSKEFSCRNELADAVCEHFGFYDTRGLRQRSGCVKALRELEAAGQFVLPAMRSRNGGRHSPRRADEAIAAPRDMPGEAGDVRGLILSYQPPLHARPFRPDGPAAAWRVTAADVTTVRA